MRTWKKAVLICGTFILMIGLWLAAWKVPREVVAQMIPAEGATPAARLAQAGQWGDQFGAFNALFSALAFGGAIIAITLQRVQHKREMQVLISEREDAEARARIESLPLWAFEYVPIAEQKWLYTLRNHGQTVYDVEFSIMGADVEPLAGIAIFDSRIDSERKISFIKSEARCTFVITCLTRLGIRNRQEFTLELQHVRNREIKVRPKWSFGQEADMIRESVARRSRVEGWRD